MILTWPSKDPDETLDFQVNWKKFLAGDVIIDSAFYLSTSNSTVSIESSTFSNTVTTAWLSGGTANTTSIILNRITTADGRVADQSIQIRIAST